MRVLFDQGTPAPLRHLLPGHEVSTAYDRGWSTLKNGELLTAAEGQGLEVLRVKVIGYLGKARYPLQLDVGYGDAVAPGPPGRPT